ncbi:MAG: hypothetical protein ACSLFP_10485 [Acidimicrobiales bacterium]
MAPPPAPRRVEPCPVCAGQCARFPDVDVHPAYPFLTEEQKRKPQPEPTPRPKGKRRPAEDRARHLEEDR